METTKKPHYGNFLVCKREMTNHYMFNGMLVINYLGKYEYGVFKICHTNLPSENQLNADPLKADKINLKPAGRNIRFENKNISASKIFNANKDIKIFSTIEEAQSYADSLNK